MIDDENYIIADSYFEFKYNETASINWRNISALQFDQSTGLPCNTNDPTREILQNLEDIAFVDINKERNTRWISQEGRTALSIL